MPRLVAFLRAINVGGHTVTMAHLRGLFEDLGFTNVETFIASGNVIFGSRPRDIVDMAVTCQVSYTLPVLTIVNGLPSVSRSSFIDRSGGTMF